MSIQKPDGYWERRARELLAKLGARELRMREARELLSQHYDCGECESVLLNQAFHLLDLRRPMLPTIVKSRPMKRSGKR